MTLGKIRHNLTFKDTVDGAGRVFDGMDITAEFLNSCGRTSTISFHYDYYSNDLRGLVERALVYHLEGKGIPKNYSNITVE